MGRARLLALCAANARPRVSYLEEEELWGTLFRRGGVIGEPYLEEEGLWGTLFRRGGVMGRARLLALCAANARPRFPILEPKLNTILVPY